MTLMKLRLDVLFADPSQHFGRDLLVFSLKFLIHNVGKIKRGIMWRKVICFVKLKAIQPQPKYKTTNFKNVIRKRLLSDID